mgnify:FL=1
MYIRADKVPESWLAKERRLAAERAERDAIAKERLAVAWTRVYDLAEMLAKALETHACVEEACLCHKAMTEWDDLCNGRPHWFDGSGE